MSKSKKVAEEEEIVFNYMQEQNRPFTVQNVVDALQKHNVKKTACERSLAALVSKGMLTKKEYGKTKLFLLAQASIELPDPEEARAVEERTKALTEELTKLSEELANARTREASLRSALSLEEARSQVEGLDKEIVEKESKLESLGDPTKLITKEEKLEIEKSYFEVRTAWKKRKRIVKEIVDQISEALGKKPKELAEEICIETDEEANVNIADFPEIPNPAKKNVAPMRQVKRQRKS